MIFFTKVRDFVESSLALKITAAERLRYATDPYNVFEKKFSDRKPVWVALVLASLFHILMFLIVFPSFGKEMLIATQQVTMLRQLAQPAALAGGGSEPETAPPKPEPKIPKAKPKLVPIPDPTPNAPEPIRKNEIEEIQRILEEVAPELNIGDITAPAGPPSRGGKGEGRYAGSGRGPAQGSGFGTGDGSGLYTIGSGITNPVLLTKTTPAYTNEAIKQKVNGVVIIQAIIRRNGRVDSFKVLRALGFGLEEQAIQEIANNWTFRPGTKNGKPVDVLATIEVQFNLR